MVAHGGPSGCSLPRQPAGILWSWGIAALGAALRGIRGSRGSFALRLMFSVGVYVRQLFWQFSLFWQLLTFGVFPMIFLCSLVFSPWGDTCLHGVPVHTIICLFIHEYIYICIHYVNNISITRKICMYDMICMVIARSVTYGAMLEVSRGIWGKGCHVLWKMRSNILAICEGKVRFRDKGSETPWDPLKLQAIKHN